MKELTKSEEIILLAIWRLGEDAYGVNIRKKVSDVVNKEYTFGTLYSHLDQLHQKSYVIKSIGEPTPERGGRRKIYYWITPSGMKALREARNLQRAMWDGIPDVAFDF
ncbi:PadR family transcriptional regulator [candidate division KSB1 bacterium]